MEFLESVDKHPELCVAIEVAMVGVDCQQLTACAGQDHVEKSRRGFTGVNGGPQGWFTESSTPPINADVGGWE